MTGSWLVSLVMRGIAAAVGLTLARLGISGLTTAMHPDAGVVMYSRPPVEVIAVDIGTLAVAMLWLWMALRPARSR